MTDEQKDYEEVRAKLTHGPDWKEWALFVIGFTALGVMIILGLVTAFGGQ